jgi:single-strand DNA-binding protein
MRKIVIIGNLTSDCEVKTFGTKNVLNFTVAVNDKFKDSSGNKVEKALFYNCNYWKENTKLSEFLTKGTKIYLEGTPDADVFKDRNGEYRASIKINVSNIELISSKKD